MSTSPSSSHAPSLSHVAPPWAALVACPYTMTRTAPSALPATVPSREQAALAIAILRSKPSHRSVRGTMPLCAVLGPGYPLICVEYVLQLRAQLRRGTGCSADPPASPYLDLVAYWQDQCRRAQEECDRLQSLNVKLERSNHLLSTRAEPPFTGSQDTVPTSPRRKARAASPVRTTRRPQQRAAQNPVPDTQDTIESDSDFLAALGDGKS